MTQPNGIDLHRYWRAESRYFAVKERVVSLIAFPAAVLLTPVIVALWIVVRTTSRGPGFYTQCRLGRAGKPFRIIKLRTMHVDAEKTTGPVWSGDNDPRVTRFGRILRKTHLDELPQIFNVLRGEMCFVGPRPERPEIVGKLSVSIPVYPDRLAVRPGVTGMAQLHLPSDKSVDCVYKKLGFDFTYTDRANWRLDLRVCLATAFKPFPLLGDWICTRISGSSEFIRAAREAADALQRNVSKTRPRSPRPAPVGVEV